jgi:hypothetical protein
LNAEADMKRELERKEQERKKSPKVEFIAAGVQSITASIPKIPGIGNVEASCVCSVLTYHYIPCKYFLSIIPTFVIYSVQLVLLCFPYLQKV